MTPSVADFLRAPLAVGHELVTDHDITLERRNLDVAMVLFTCHASLFALPLTGLTAVITGTAVARVPFLRGKYCRGFIPYDGEAIPVTNLSALLGCRDFSTQDPYLQLIILESGNLRTALQVTKVDGISRVHFRDVSTHTQGRLSIRQGWRGEETVAALDSEEIAKSLRE